MAMLWFSESYRPKVIFLPKQNQFLKIDSSKLRLINASDMSLIQESEELPNQLSIAEEEDRLQIDISEDGNYVIIKKLNKSDLNVYKLTVWDLAQNNFFQTKKDEIWDFQQAGNAVAFLVGDSISVYKNGEFITKIYHSEHKDTGIHSLWSLKESILVQYTDSSQIFHDLEGGKSLVVNEISKQNLRNYLFSKDGNWLYIFDDKEVILFDWEIRKPVSKWTFPVGMMQTISLVPNSNQIITTHKDHTMRVWDVSEKQPKLVKTYFGNDFKDAYYDADKKRIVSENSIGEGNILLEWEF